jgi:hypothetical protein
MYSPLVDDRATRRVQFLSESPGHREAQRASVVRQRHAGEPAGVFSARPDFEFNGKATAGAAAAAVADPS